MGPVSVLCRLHLLRMDVLALEGHPRPHLRLGTRFVLGHSSQLAECSQQLSHADILEMRAGDWRGRVYRNPVLLEFLLSEERTGF